MADVLRFVLRLPPDLHGQLKELADREGRSLHGQILYMLRECVNRESTSDKP